MNGRDYKRIFDLVDDNGFFETFEDESFFSELNNNELALLINQFQSSIDELNKYIRADKAPPLEDSWDDDDLDHLDNPSRWRRYIRELIDDEGFDYLFKCYDTFARIKDEGFHERRRAFLGANNELADYMGLDDEMVDVDIAEDNEKLDVSKDNLER